MKRCFLLVLLSPLFILFSCSKKCKEVGTYSFSSPEKSIIPYTGNDTIVIHFEDNIEDQLKGSGKHDDFIYYNESTSAGQQDTQCDGDYYYCEIITVNYTTIEIGSAVTMSFALKYENPFTSSGLTKKFTVKIGATYDPSIFFDAECPVLHDSILVDNTHVFYYDTLTIGSKLFSKVYKINNQYNASTYIEAIFYTFKDGILKADNSYGSPWYFTWKR